MNSQNGLAFEVVGVDNGLFDSSENIEKPFLVLQTRKKNSVTSLFRGYWIPSYFGRKKHSSNSCSITTLVSAMIGFTHHFDISEFSFFLVWTWNKWSVYSAIANAWSEISDFLPDKKKNQTWLRSSIYLPKAKKSDFDSPFDNILTLCESNCVVWLTL